MKEKKTNKLFQLFITLSLVLIYSSITCAQESSEKKRPKIGLVLSGGGARGFAHIGVLQWFEEHHIPVDYLAGTSMGGLIGGMYAIGKTPQEMKDIAYNINWIDLFRPVPAYSDLDFRRKQDRRDYPNAIELGLKKGLKLPSGLNSGHQIGILFSELTLPYSDIGSFDNLPIPFRCIATDMVEAKPVVLSSGSLALALQATMSIPGVFAPVEIDNKILASDGGLLNNIPTDVMKKMGVDIIIGVDIGTPLGKRESMSSITGVLGQMIGVVTIENVRRNRELADILITPNLKQYFTMDFQAARDITDLGYAGTEQEASKLLPLALNDKDWEEHMNARRSRIRQSVPEPQFITVAGTTPSASREIEHTLKEFVDQPINIPALNKELTQIWGRGRYLAVGYRMTEVNEQPGLLIHTSEKAYAPPFLNLALEMNNTRADVLDVNLRGRATFFDFLSEGSEIRLDASIGSELSLGAEYFYLIDQTHFFLAPYAFTKKTKTGIFFEEEQIAQYNFRESSIGADVGYQFGTTGEVRLGYQIGRLKASREIGDPVLPELAGEESEVSLRFLHDNVDSAVIPTRGFLLSSGLRYVIDSPVLEGLENDQSFTQFSARAAAFFPFSPKNTIFVL
ncbi:MAG TPA: patatin-like phospholipase family protein, partial [Acidobacteriota bacterium]|nr:patatin-like phospholipase family protein [Acidobacteriota bacterium]